LAYAHDDRACLAQFLRQAIEADADPLSPRVRRWTKLLAKIDPASARAAVMPFAAPRRIGEPSHVLQKKRGWR
jgi:hypothetical protein